jgi:hypothetical protein
LLDMDNGTANNTDHSEYFSFQLSESDSYPFTNDVFIKLTSNYNGPVILIITAQQTGNGFGNICYVNYDCSISSYGGTTFYLTPDGNAPSTISKHEFYWNWTITIIPKCENAQYDACTHTFNTHHCCYVIWDTPVNPMEESWIGVLDVACDDMLNGGTYGTAEEVIVALTTNLYSSGVIYNGGRSLFSDSSNDFKLKSLLEAWPNRNSTNLQMDCRDFANFILVLSTALGIDCHYLNIDFECGGQGETAPLYSIQPAGCEILYYYDNYEWDFHQVVWFNSSVLDASTKINISSSQVNTIMIPVTGMDITDYIGYLTSCTNYTTSINKCNPVYQ